MYLKVHRVRGQGEVLAVCDPELIDRTLRHGDVDVPISRGFYGDRLATEDEVREALKEASNINLFGRRAVELACELGLIGEGDCLLIDEVPHAQIYLL